MHREIAINGMWGLRAETLELTVQRVLESFEELARLSGHWGHWYRSYYTLEDWERPAVEMTSDFELVRHELLRGQNRNEEDGSVIESLGYSIRAWAGPERGHRAETTELSVSCCHRAVSAGPNVLLITLPSRGYGAEKLLETDLIASAIDVLVRIWSPEWVAARELLTELVGRPWSNGPVLAWVNYFDPSLARVIGLANGWRWWKSAPESRIFIHAAGLPTPANPEHVRDFVAMNDHITWQRREWAIARFPDR